MNLSEELELVFKQFLASEKSKSCLRSLVANIDEGDVNTLINAVEQLEDPSEYCEDDYDNKTVAGFFLYIDFISALIINLGEPAITLASKYGNSEHPFVPWVVKYVGDVRFHDEIMAKFDNIFKS